MESTRGCAKHRDEKRSVKAGKEAEEPLMRDFGLVVEASLEQTRSVGCRLEDGKNVMPTLSFPGLRHTRRMPPIR